jgi:hypothetical protein
MLTIWNARISATSEFRCLMDAKIFFLTTSKNMSLFIKSERDKFFICFSVPYYTLCAYNFHLQSYHITYILINIIDHKVLSLTQIYPLR